MRYLEAADDLAWTRLSEHLSESEALDMVLFAYPSGPESGFPEPFEPASDFEALGRITQYENGEQPPRSARLRLTSAALASIRRQAGGFVHWGDTLALFRPDSTQWMAAYIPHESMILVAEPSLTFSASIIGLEFTRHPPDWW